MIYGSVCSGIEAATVAWHPLGWKCAFASEIEAFPRAVLQHRWKDIPLHGDFTTIQAGEYEPIDLLVGGTPCQSFSVAGLRGGLDDDRGNLALEYLRLADRLRTRWLVWENVPGVLSSAGGRDFGAILGGMVELGYGVAYRVLDAQFFGVAQRRRRVFVVGYLGDWRRASAVLFEHESLSGHPAPRREKGEGATYDVAPGLTASGRGVERPGESRGQDPIVAVNVFGGNNTSGPIDVAPARNACASASASGRMDFESEAFVVSSDVAHALRGEGFDASEDGTGRGTPIVPVSLVASDFDGRVAFALGSHAGTAEGDQTNRSHAAGGPVGSGISEERAHSLRAGRTQAVAFALRGREGGAQPEVGGEVSNALRTPGGGASVPMVAASAVRRLTPRECERLQGFPDDYTLIPWRKGEAPDGPRYKALGNSMAVPVMAWIGRRIEAVEALQPQRAAA